MVKSESAFWKETVSNSAHADLNYDFDAKFYGRYYKDLSALKTDQELTDHFANYGRKEGRFANGEEMVTDLQSRLGALPDDFEPIEYRVLHKDLADLVENYTLKEHYLLFGRAEKRAYLYDLASYEADYQAYVQNHGASNDYLGERPYPLSFRLFLRSYGISSVSWLETFKLGEFVLFNADWLHEAPSSRMAGLCAFASQGLTRMAPIAAACRFDPGFYRTIVNRPDASDLDLYRDWLNHGMERGDACSEGAFLRKLIGEDAFPACFDVRAYKAGVSDPGLPSGRPFALEHYIDVGFAAGIRSVVMGAGSAAFYGQLGEHYFSEGRSALALEAFNSAVALSPTSGTLRHRRGDALRNLGREREAVPDFVFAASQPGARIWSHIHAAEGLALEDRPEAALEQVLRSAPTCRGSAPWRAAAHQVLARVFEADTRHAHGLYREGRRAEADAAVNAHLRRLTDAITAVDPLPAPLPRPLHGPVVIVANRDLPQCDHYRVTQKAQQLLHGGWTFEIYDQAHADAYRPALDRARAVIFYRVVARPAIIHAILYARALGIPTIYEIDDLIFEPAVYPDPFESFEGQITETDYIGLQYGVPLFRHAMSLCDIGLASTPALAEAMRPLARSGICHVLRNGLDDRNAAFLDRSFVPFAPAAVTLFYGSGTKAHNIDFTELVAPALLTLLRTHAHVRLVVAGYLHLDERFAPVSGQVRQLGFTSDIDAYWEVLSGVDINLAVLARSPTTDAKSEIKWLEAAVFAIPSVVSATRTYREVLVDGEDVLMAEAPRDWHDALERLIADPDLRRRIGQRARLKARARYDLDGAVDTLKTFLPPPAATRGEVAKPLATAPRRPVPLPAPLGCRPRILIVHVFFPPQATGGATRVLCDNIDYMIDHAGGAFDLAVVASDDGAEPPYRTRTDAYRGVPVHRIASPCEAFMDWRPFDPNMRQPFERILERFDPDLVHVHCIQRLTGTVVEAVRARGTPYVVTLHDAWWISDYQFLIDADDQLHLPQADPVETASDRAFGPVRSIARRRQLGRLLDGAQALLAVSETFAGLYRNAGFPQTRALPNGVSRFTPAARVPSPTGRVRLGHIGNRAAHKGATLVEFVLRTTPFRHLTLTLVEHGREPGYVREEVWGTTPVQIVGPVSQGAIASLYAQFDVLLAPSLWPESFGLVTREAQAAGLWVIASDRGAIGEDIRDGIDGYRIDVSTAQGLRTALLRLDAEPARFLVSPPDPNRPLRTADDQGADLLALYRELVC